MRRAKIKIFGILMVVLMVFASGTAVFAASPNEQVINCISASPIPGTAAYAGLAESFLRDTDKVLTQAEADQICGTHIANATAIYTAANGNITTAVTDKLRLEFEAASAILGFNLTDLSRGADGSFSFTIYDPISGKSVVVQGNQTSQSGATGTTGTTGTTGSTGSVTGSTQVAKTGIDNSLFALAAILGLTTIGAGFVLYRKNAIN